MATDALRSDGAVRRVTLGELERAVHAADRAAFFAEPRVLRRVIKFDRRIASIGLQVPHRKTYTIGREALLEIVEPDELHPADDLPETVILLSRPQLERINTLPPDQVLLRYWRRLFHARVHAELEAKIAAGRLTRAAVRERIHRIGQAEFDEVRAVLRNEDLLLPPRDDAMLYVEFAAVFLELEYFEPAGLQQFFPSIADTLAAKAVLLEDVDAPVLFARTRPAGAAPPEEQASPDSMLSIRPVAAVAPDARSPGGQKRKPPRQQPGLSEKPDFTETAARAYSPRRFRRLRNRAKKAAAVGNDVRGAILCLQAGRSAPREQAAEAEAAPDAHLDRLVDRLRGALGFDDADADAWRAALRALLPAAADGIWPVERRLLYDLQKVCVDHEREIYTVNLGQWILSLGRRRLRRPLPHQRDVLISKHLRQATKHFAAAQMPDVERAELSRLLRRALHRAEELVRGEFRPLVAAALDRVALVPRNLPERVARRKLVEEILDRVVERGYLTLAHVRDAVSRNNLKLPDLAGPRELLRGDRLLQADRALSRPLDGVYRPAEAYLRALSRLSALAFANPVGRVLTRFVALPFGGAFVALLGIDEIVAHAAEWLGHEVHLGLANVSSIGLLSLFLLAVINVRSFRSALRRVAKLTRRGVARGIELLGRLLGVPLVRRLLRSRAFLLARRYVLKPLLFAAAAWLALSAADVELHESVLGGVALFALMNLILNSRAVRDVEEITNDRLVRYWHTFRVQVLAGIFWFVVDLFKRVLETIDRVLYGIDEWLRFRAGEGPVTFVSKAIFGLLWSVVAYVVRFCVTLLIEPQVNPIKHFPVVTVSHKLLLPTLPFVLVPLLKPFLGERAAASIAIAVTTVIPGVFGFLVWELKENWRLYEANRPRELRPAIIGHHGETMLRLMKPGIHSGTLPKLYRKLRKAERKLRRGEAASPHKYREAIEEVKRSVHHFVEREFVALLDETRCWNYPISAGEVGAGSNRIRVELRCPELGRESLWLAFEEQSGWLIANVLHAGWLAKLHETQGSSTHDVDSPNQLSPEPRTRNPGPPALGAFRNALIGLYKFSGVDLCRQQIETFFPPHAVTYDVADHRLVVWPGRAYEVEVVYDLEARPRIDARWNGRHRAARAMADPAVASGSVLRSAGHPFPPTTERSPSHLDSRFAPPPRLAASDLIFRERAVTWQEWLHVWGESETAGRCPALLEDAALLPPKKGDATLFESPMPR